MARAPKTPSIDAQAPAADASIAAEQVVTITTTRSDTSLASALTAEIKSASLRGEHDVAGQMETMKLHVDALTHAMRNAPKMPESVQSAIDRIKPLLF